MGDFADDLIEQADLTDLLYDLHNQNQCGPDCPWCKGEVAIPGGIEQEARNGEGGY